MNCSVSFNVPASLADRVVGTLEDSEPAPLVVGVFDGKDGTREIFGHYAAEPDETALTALLRKIAGDAVSPLRISLIEDADWVTLSQGQRAPVRAGRFLVHGNHDRSRVSRHRFTIEIDAARAFGTAHHASTRGCLLALDRLLKRRRPRIILDLGTGTGILAIAAARTLRAMVHASDSDPIAVAIAAGNAKKNGVGSFIRALKAEGFAHRELRRIKPDLVLANLLERALLELAPIMAQHMHGGSAILSGLTNAQSRGIEALYRAFGFDLERRIVLDGWTTLLLTRRKIGALRD